MRNRCKYTLWSQGDKVESNRIIDLFEELDFLVKNEISFKLENNMCQVILEGNNFHNYRKKSFIDRFTCPIEREIYDSEYVVIKDNALCIMKMPKVLEEFFIKRDVYVIEELEDHDFRNIISFRKVKSFSEV